MKLSQLSNGVNNDKVNDIEEIQKILFYPDELIDTIIESYSKEIDTLVNG